MEAQIGTHIDSLAASTTIKAYDKFSIVTIPGAEDLSESERAAVLDKALCLQTGASPDPDLLSRLRSITPPVDEQEAIEEAQILESQARQELENDGCSPCYPQSMGLPLQQSPDAYHGILSYWKSLPRTGDVVLCAQLADWQRFRAHQKKVREFYRRERLPEYMDKIRERQQGHGILSGVMLQWEIERQNRLENWAEYQDYHFRWLERLEKERDEAKLKAAKLKAHGLNMRSEPGHAESATETLKRRKEYYEGRIQDHKVLLQWIKQEWDSMHEAMLANPSSRSKRAKVARERRVSKRRKPGTSTTRSSAVNPCGLYDQASQATEASDLKNRNQTKSNSTTPRQDSIQAGPAERVRSDAEPLFPVKPSNDVLLAAGSCDRSMRLRKGRRPVADKHVSGTRHSETGRVRGEVKTRSGRISKRPDRWTS